MLEQMMKSLIDQDRAAVVMCDLEHKICYMNPAAKLNYAAWGGDLTGKCLLDCHNADSRRKIDEVIAWFQEDNSHNMIHTFYNEKQAKDGYMVALRDEDGRLIGYYEKHEYRTRETADFYDFSKSLV